MYNKYSLNFTLGTNCADKSIKNITKVTHIAWLFNEAAYMDPVLLGDAYYMCVSSLVL